MAESMYKGMLGWSFADEKHEGTHILMTNMEYNQFVDETNTALRKKAEAENKAASEIRRIQVVANQKIKEKQEESQNFIDRLDEKLQISIKEANYWKGLNENLLRISKERANADRKLKPKKEHSGYVIISSQEKEIRYKKGKQMISAIVWETVIQSPYNVKFTELQARTQIYGELLTNEGGWKLGDIGIKSRNMTNYDELLKDNEEDIKDKNIAFNQRLRANYKVGYWEYILLHTLPVENVPKDMLP